MKLPRHSKLNQALARKCRNLVRRVAKKHGIPPACVVAHVRSADADAARIEVWREMVNSMGMTRQLVATIFGRDRRRIRASVLGKNDSSLLAPGRRIEPLRVYRPLMPFQPVGNQFVWNFAVPLVIAPAINVERFMRPVPVPARQDLDEDSKRSLIRFYEREARALRKSASGV